VLSWLIEPTVMTLLVSFLMWLWQPNIELVGMTAVVFGLIFFTAFSDGRGEEFRRVVFKSEKSRAERVQSKLSVTQGEDTIEDTTTKAVFMEPVNGEMVPVTMAFYTPFRIIMTLLGVIVFNGLPAIFAWMLDFDGVAQYQYNGAWMVLTVPITIILWIAVGRIRVYNYPVFRMILPDGKTKPVKSDNARSSSIWGMIKDLKEIAGWGPLLAVGGFLLFMFLGTLAAILTPD
jgi:hypothetical protein